MVTAKFSPSDYVKAYRNLEIMTARGCKQTGVVQYLCRIYTPGLYAEADSFWQAVMPVILKKKLIIYNDLPWLAECFHGKGSPGWIRYALWAVDQVNPDEVPKYRDDLSGDDRIDKVCMKFIGVDCNGFAGNYCVDNLHPGCPPANFPNLLPALWKNLSPISWRSKVSDIKPLDVLIYPGNHHIAIIDSKQGSTFTICQSTGGGPQTSFGHTIQEAGSSDNTPQFQVSNGTGLYGPPPSQLPALLRIKSIGFNPDIPRIHEVPVILHLTNTSSQVVVRKSGA